MMRQKYHGPLPCTGYSLSIQLAPGYQDFLSVFKDDLNFITGQKLGHNAEPKGGVIDEVIDLEMARKGIGNFLVWGDQIHHLSPDFLGGGLTKAFPRWFERC